VTGEQLFWLVLATENLILAVLLGILYLFKGKLIKDPVYWLSGCAFFIYSAMLIATAGLLRDPRTVQLWSALGLMVYLLVPIGYLILQVFRND
jgi:hypothetical protein